MEELEQGLSSTEAARFLGVAKTTMATWRLRGVGPIPHYSGGKPVYYLSELKAWQAACTAARQQPAPGIKRQRGRPRKHVALAQGANG